MFLSLMSNSTTLKEWSTHSMVVRAVASDPAGPFKRVQDVLPVFHHNPQITRAPDGTFLLFSIGQSASQGSGGVFRTELHYSMSLEGPWTNLGEIVNGSNPSAHVLSNGTVVVAFKGKPNGLRIAVADHWRGPYRVLSNAKGSEILLQPQPYGQPYIEDFDLWFNTSAKRWMILLHQYAFSGSHVAGPGGFAWSADESLLSTWTFAGASHAMYNATIELDDGTSLLSDRQRPKLLFGTDGEPAFLYNGLDQKGQAGPTHTFVQRIRGWVPPVGARGG